MLSRDAADRCDRDPAPERQPARRAAHRRGAKAICLLALVVLALTAVGCRSGDRRPWMICHRIYDQCRSAIGSLTQEQCETLIAKKPPAVIGALCDCVRDKFCERFAAECKQPIRIRPGL